MNIEYSKFAIISTEVNNYAPEFTTDTPTVLMVPKDLPMGAVITTITATDNDTNLNTSTVSYFIRNPGYQLRPGTSNGIEVFRIGIESGTITLIVPLNTSTNSEFLLTIEAVDNGQVPQSAQHVLTVIPSIASLPVPQFSETEYTAQIPEDTSVNSTIVNVSCIESNPDSESSDVIVSLLQGSNSSPFVLEGGSQLILTQELDFESLPNRDSPIYHLELLCTNRYNISTMAQVGITIVNVDDNPFVFSNDSYSASIPENAMRSYSILRVRAFDNDEPNGMIIYSIENQLNAFQIDSSSGEIFVANEMALDRELQENYTLTVRAELVVNSQTFQNYTEVDITLLDVNDNPPRFNPSLYFAPTISTRNMSGDYLLTIHATDDDLGENGTITYQLEANNFLVVNESTGDIYINSSSLLFGSFMINVYAIDGGKPPRNGSAAISIVIRPSPERVEFINGNMPIEFTVREDRPRGFLIGRLAADIIDENNAVVTHNITGRVRYSIINGTEPFFISETTGELHLLSTLDFETSNTHLLTIEATLPGDPQVSPASTTVQITVTNVNDNPPVFRPRFYARVVEEFTSANISILNVYATDRDIEAGGSGTITYSLQNLPKECEVFEVDEDTGSLTARVSLDKPRDYRCYVIASDGEMTSQAVVFISVVRSASVTPTFTRDHYIFNISENVQLGTNIGAVQALTRGNRSIEEYSHLLYQIRMPDIAGLDTGSGDGALFHINPESGNISTLGVFDAERQDVYAFFVEVYNASDSMHIFGNATVEIQIQDENDNPPVFEQSLYTLVITVAEPVGSTVLTVNAIDEDHSETNRNVRYSLTPNAIFDINSMSGNITVVSNSLLEVGNYRLTATARDGGSPTQSGTATVFIAVMPAIPESINFTRNEYHFTVREDAPHNTLVGVVEAVDHLNMSQEDIVYSTPNVTECLHIDPNDGEIRVVCSLNRERDARYELLVTANFTQTAEVGRVKVVVNVLDINDEDPVFTLDIYAKLIQEDFGNESAVVTVEAVDQDAGQNGTVEYSLQQDNNGRVLTPANSTTQMINPIDLFRINSSSGEIFLIGATVPPGDYKLTVMATDLGIPERRTSTALVLICVTRAPPPSLGFTSTEFSIAENEPGGTVVGTVALRTASGADINPADYANNLQFSITGGDTRNLFYIVPGNGTVRTLIPLDREEASSHVIEVLATFSEFENLSFNQSIAIQIIDRNDENPVFVLSQYAVMIDDSYNTGTPVLNVSARDIDEDKNGALSFTIDSGTPFGINITSVSGVVTSGIIFIANASILSPHEYRFTITATDNGTMPRNGTAPVLVVVNHAIPESISFPITAYSFSLIENSPPGTFVGRVSVEQSTPALDDLVYYISGGTGDGSFHCDPSTGNITSLLLVDREMYTQLNLNISASLPGEPTLPSTTTQVTINITDVNDNRPLFHPSSYALRLTSNITTEQKLLTVFAHDADEGSNQQLQYSIIMSDPTSSFRISTNGDIFATSAPLPAAIYTLTVVARDMGSPPLNGSAIVVITVREPIPQSILFTEARYHFNISEYTPSGSRIGNVTLRAIPQEFRQYVTFNTASRNFSIVPSTGEIRTRINLDYEVRQSYSFTVETHFRIPSEDPPVSLTAAATVNVNVIDENDNTPEFVDFPSTLFYPENRTFQEAVRTITAEDLDSGTNGMLRYEILNDVSGKLILDMTSGVLSVAASLDHEEQEEYVLNIRVSDMGTPQRSSENIMIFTLLDINDNPPVLTSGLVYRVRERIPTSTFTLTATDQDLGGFGNVRYTFLAPSVLFAVNENTGEVTVQELDYETGPANHMYPLTLRLSDNWNPQNSSSNTNTVDQVIRIEVTDAPDNSPRFSQPSYLTSTDPTVDQDETMVTVSAQDADNDRITYSITDIRVQGNGGNRPSFAIDPTTGRIYSRIFQEFAPESVFTMTVQAQDDSEFTLTSTSQVVISVLPQMLAFTQPSYTASIMENAQTGSTVTTLSIQQLARSSNIEYSAVVTQPLGQSSVFRAVNRSEVDIDIILNSRLDRELVDRYTVRVTATRPNPSETATTTLTVDILDYNDHPPVFTDDSGTVIVVHENTPSSTVISRANATDADIGSNDELQFSFVSRPPDLPFNIDPSTGVISTAGVIDYEVTQRFTLRVQVSDSGTPQHSATNVYYVNVTNENDNHPQFEARAYFGEVYAGAPNNYRVHHTIIRVTDADDPQNQQQISFEISIPTGTGLTGYELQVADREPYYVVAVSIPDSARSQLLEFRVRVTDEGGLTSEVPLYLSIFTSENLIRFVLDGVDLQDFLSCENDGTSGCRFRNTVADVVGRLSSVNAFVSFYNDSVQVSTEDTQK